MPVILFLMLGYTAYSLDTARVRNIYVGSDVHAYSPFLDINSKKFFWTVRDPLRLGDTNDLQYMKKFDKEVNFDVSLESESFEIDLPFTPTSVGNVRISKGGDSALFSTTVVNEDTLWSIYLVKRDGEIWKDPELIIQSYNWTGHPGFSEKSDKIYFASISSFEDAKNFGKSDIFSIETDEDGVWNTIRNLGQRINSEEDELSPFCYFDINDTVLYFSSNKIIERGLDIYKARMTIEDEEINWGNPAAMIAYNTLKDDAFFTIPYDTSLGQFYFFSSNRSKDNRWLLYGNWVTQIKKVFFLAGSVTNARTGEKIKNSEIVIREVPDGSGRPKFATTVLNDTTGKYKIVELEKGVEFEIKAYSEDMFFDSYKIVIKDDDTLLVIKPDSNATFAIELEKDREFEVTAQGQDLFYDAISLKMPINDSSTVVSFAFNVSEKLTLRINFPTNKYRDPYTYTIDDDGTETGITWDRELDILAENILITQSKLSKLQLVGHTDDVGENESNILLGQRRVDFIIEQLIDRGVPEDLLIGISSGETEPLVQKEGESMDLFRKRCRRVELQKVLDTKDDEDNSPEPEE